MRNFPLKKNLTKLAQVAGLTSVIFLATSVVMHDGFNTLPKLLLVLGLLVVVAHIVLAHLVVSSYGDTLRGAEDIERELGAALKTNTELEFQVGSLTSKTTTLEESMRESNEAFEARTKRLQSLFTELPVPAISFDLEGMIFEWNEAAAAMTGMPSRFVFAQNVFDMFPDDTCAKGLEADFVMLAKGDRPPEWSGEYRSFDGRSFSITWQSAPLKAHDGSTVGVVATFYDAGTKVAVKRPRQKLAS